jgi:hypothetical protein
VTQATHGRRPDNDSGTRYRSVCERPILGRLRDRSIEADGDSCIFRSALSLGNRAA